MYIPYFKWFYTLEKGDGEEAQALLTPLLMGEGGWGGMEGEDLGSQNLSLPLHLSLSL